MDLLRLAPEELELIRGWFDCAAELDIEYLQRSDFELAQKIYLALDYPVPDPIKSALRNLARDEP